ncbi:hypothetical protein EJ06DRAFT_522498 [Trichodelitschia bisporula]|uniref:Uncharacterized protein n=1 Tax=Trichodelitschia bisporula TaxID=703511 RepID=A0A6G1HUB0_9PEZI|nr:hypothetical protein EJ06DRAFT_522498 [Trichodelitschia bisporula]
MRDESAPHYSRWVTPSNSKPHDLDLLHCNGPEESVASVTPSISRRCDSEIEADERVAMFESKLQVWYEFINGGILGANCDRITEVSTRREYDTPRNATLNLAAADPVLERDPRRRHGCDAQTFTKWQPRRPHCMPDAAGQLQDADCIKASSQKIFEEDSLTAAPAPHSSPGPLQQPWPPTFYNVRLKRERVYRAPYPILASRPHFDTHSLARCRCPPDSRGRGHFVSIAGAQTGAHLLLAPPAAGKRLATALSPGQGF